MINIRKQNKPYVFTIRDYEIKSIEDNTEKSVYKIKIDVQDGEWDDDHEIIYSGTGFYLGGDYEFDFTSFVEGRIDRITRSGHSFYAIEEEIWINAKVSFLDKNNNMIDYWIVGPNDGRPIERPVLSLPEIQNTSIGLDVVKERAFASYDCFAVYPIYYFDINGARYMLDTSFITDGYTVSDAEVNFTNVDMGLSTEMDFYAFKAYVVTSNYMMGYLRNFTSKPQDMKMNYKLYDVDDDYIEIDANSSFNMSFQPIYSWNDDWDNFIPDVWGVSLTPEELNDYYNKNLRNEVNKTQGWPTDLIDHCVGYGLSYVYYNSNTGNGVYGRKVQYNNSPCKNAGLVLINPDIISATPSGDIVVPLRVENDILKGEVKNKLDKVTYIDKFSNSHNSVASNIYTLTAYVDPEWIKTTTGADMNYMKLIAAMQTARKTYVFGNCKIAGMEAVGLEDFKLDCKVVDVEEITLYSRYNNTNRVPSLKIEIEIYA